MPVSKLRFAIRISFRPEIPFKLQNIKNLRHFSLYPIPIES